MYIYIYDVKVPTKVTHFDSKVSTEVKHFDPQVCKKGKGNAGLFSLSDTYHHNVRPLWYFIGKQLAKFIKK